MHIEDFCQEPALRPGLWQEELCLPLFGKRTFRHVSVELLANLAPEIDDLPTFIHATLADIASAWDPALYPDI